MDSLFENNLAFAKKMDAADPLGGFRINSIFPNKKMEQIIFISVVTHWGYNPKI